MRGFSALQIAGWARRRRRRKRYVDLPRSQISLRFSGVRFGTIGVASVSLAGTASHLRSAADIAGGYTTVGAGFAFVGGPKVARLQNARGVVLRLRGVQVGFNLSLNLSGMTVAIGS